MSTTEEPTGFDPLVLRHTFGQFPTGVTVVTAAPRGEPVGMTVGSFFSVSLDPPLVGFCADMGSSSWPVMAEAGSFAVNVLAADQAAISSLFAGPDDDRFAGVDWRAAPSGAPLLPDVLAWLDCTTEQVFDAGDHWIIVGRITALDVERDALPLVFWRGGYGRFDANTLGDA